MCPWCKAADFPSQTLVWPIVYSEKVWSDSYLFDVPQMSSNSYSRCISQGSFSLKYYTANVECFFGLPNGADIHHSINDLSLDLYRKTQKGKHKSLWKILALLPAVTMKED